MHERHHLCVQGSNRQGWCQIRSRRRDGAFTGNTGNHRTFYTHSKPRQKPQKIFHPLCIQIRKDKMLQESRKPRCLPVNYCLHYPTVNMCLSYGKMTTVAISDSCIICACVPVHRLHPHLKESMENIIFQGINTNAFMLLKSFSQKLLIINNCRQLEGTPSCWCLVISTFVTVLGHLWSCELRWVCRWSQTCFHHSYL